MVTFVSRILYGILLPVVLVAVWWFLAKGSDSFWVPEPVGLIDTFYNVWIGDRIYEDIVPSIARLVAGLLIAIAGGIAVGLSLGLSGIARRAFEPLLEFFRALPPPALIPILMVLLGVNDRMKIVVIVAGCIWPIILNTIEGVRAMDSIVSETSDAYRIKGLSRLRYVILPSTGPFFMTGIRQALPLGLILMVISEMFASSSGLGFTIVKFQRSFAVPEMWSGILLLGVIGIALAGLFALSENRMLGWYYGMKKVEKE